jgi:glycosyltransferase involved in cell wall biosynthesis
MITETAGRRLFISERDIFMIATTSRQKRILFLDDHVPYPELGVGYPRARRLICNLSDIGYAVTFIPLEFPGDNETSARRILPANVELILKMKPDALAAFLRSHLETLDLIFVSRPDNMRFLLGALDELQRDPASIPILYDAEAIFSMREILRYSVEGKPLSTHEKESMIDDEMGLARDASHVTAVSESDAATFRAAGCRSVSVLADGLDFKPTTRKFSECHDLLFIGALDDDPSPNVDALVWFVENVMPRLRTAIRKPPRLVIAGRCGARRVQALAGHDIVLLGTVSNLESLHDSARIFIAPHRYAAGIPNKVLEASAYGLPCVISELLARHLGWSNDVEVLTAASAGEYVDSLLRLYSDEKLWTSLRTSALKAIESRFSLAIFRENIDKAIEMTLSRALVKR